MGIDASIYGNLGRGVRSVADYDNEARAAKLNDLQLLTAQSQYDQGQRAIQDDNALRAMTLTGDESADYAAMRRISPKAADTYRKAQLDAKKTQGDIDKAGAETASKKIETKIRAHDFHIQQLGSLTDASQIDAWAAQGVRDGVLGMQASMEGARQMKEFAAQNGFEAAKQQALRGGMSAMQQLQAAHSDAVLKETGRHNVATEGQAATRDAETGRHNKTTEGLTARGQNITRDAALQGGSVQIDSQGNMVVVPNKVVPGQPAQVSPVVGAGGAPVKGKDAGAPKISAEVQRQIGGVVSFDKDLGALEEALKDFNPRNPLDQADTTKRARIQSLSKQAQLSAKEAAALGALSGPDMALLEGILNDPTGFKGAVSGSSGIAAQIAEARAGNKRRVKSLNEQYGDKATSGIQLEGAGAEGVPDDIAAILKKHGGK